MTRDGIIAAIRAGHTTAPAISRLVGSPPYEVSNQLYKMRDIGRVYTTGPIEADGERPGRPPVKWAVNEAWRSKRYSQEAIAKQAERRLQAGPEAEQRRIDGIRAAHAVRRAAKLIPAWVNIEHRRTYYEIARVLDEETAAMWARKAKHELRR